MTDLQKIRAEIEKLRNTQTDVFPKAYVIPALDHVLDILDTAIAEAEKKPSERWDVLSHRVLPITTWRVDFEYCSLRVTMVHDGIFRASIKDIKTTTLIGEYPTLRAAQLAAEAEMKKMEEKHVS
jgi:hypothetical protein